MKNCKYVSLGSSWIAPYLHLRYLTHRVLEQKLGAELSLSEICELNRRKDAVLDYFDGLVFFHGYDAVVVD